MVTAPRRSRLGDRLTLALGELGLGVEHGVLDPALVQLLGEHLGDLDRDRAHEHRLAGGVARLDLPGDRRPLALLGLVDLVVAVLADHRHVGRDLDDRQLVDLHELGGLSEGRSGHAGELVVHPEVVLQRDRGQRLVLLLDADPLLGLHRLVQALRPAPALEDATGVLVDDLDLAVDDRVVVVAAVERLGLERLDEVVDEVTVLGAVEVVDPQEPFGLGDALLGDRDRLVLLVELVVEVGDELLLGLRVQAVGRLAGLHLGRQPRELGVGVGGLLGRPGDDQRGARLVDEDVVDLVDDGEAVIDGLAVGGLLAPAVLEAVLQALGHVVAQVVKAELRVRPVGDVGGVGGDLLLRVLHVLQHPDGHAEHVVDRLHPHRVAARQVVVDGDHVDAQAGQRVQDDGQRRRQRLALAGLHLGDAAVVQDHAADHLDVEVAHAHGPPAGLAGQREGLEQQLVERLAVAGALAQLVGGLAQLLVVVELDLSLESVDPGDLLLV